MPQKLLDQFTAETGVKVNYVVTGWDATHNKLLVANEAKSYIADVAEFDWSFTGQFAGAQWVEPLEGMVDQKTLDDLTSTDKAFISGGKTYAACYSNDFRVSMYNKAMFAKAGIDKFPATFDELTTDVQKLKASGRAVPAVDPDGGHRGRGHAVVPADPGDGRTAVRRPATSRPSPPPTPRGTRRCSGRSTRSRTAGSRPAPSRWTTPSR